MARSTPRAARALTFLLLACTAPGAIGAPAKTPVVTTTQVRIDVDVGGQVTGVEPTSPLPAPPASAIRDHVRGWRFDPPLQDGQPVAGTTYARMSVCAAAVGDELAFTLGAPQHGPGLDPRMLRPFFFPTVSNAIELGRLEMDVVYEVRPDGRAEVVSLTTTPDKPGIRREVTTAFRKWLAPMRFEPERLDGQPVATRMQVPWTFTWERTTGRLPGRDLQRERVESDPSCQALLGKGAPDGRPVAVDSRFRIQPSG